jgi:CDP-diglyceride synthetase
MQFAAIGRVLFLLAVANGTPVFAKDLLGKRYSHPLDGGLRFADGRPLFGASKTWRGILLSVLVTALCAPLAGMSWGVGALAGGAAMAGDLCSSFLKRRIGLPSGARATGLDQLPESLFPALVCWNPLSLAIWDVVAVTAIFLVGEMVLSLLLFRIHLRDQPY